MLKLLTLFSKASAKLAATFVTVIVLMLAGFAFFPGAVNSLSDFTNYLEGFLRNPPLNEQATVLFRTLVNEQTIFGIIITMIARSFVEFVAWFFGRGSKMLYAD
ncbi:MAG: hypothetical protein AAF583_06500 [Pseudomonadota bacterium]